MSLSCEQSQHLSRSIPISHLNDPVPSLSSSRMTLQCSLNDLKSLHRVCCTLERRLFLQSPNNFAVENALHSTLLIPAMPQLLRRKLTCFYCNRRSAQDRVTGIRKWLCERCDAFNHLDEVCLPNHNLSIYFCALLIMFRMARSQIRLPTRHLQRFAMLNPKQGPSHQTPAISSARCSANDAFRTSTS